MALTLTPNPNPNPNPKPSPNRPLVIYDDGRRKHQVLTKLLQDAGVARCIDGVAAPLVPLVVPNPNPSSLTLTLTPTLTP